MARRAITVVETSVFSKRADRLLSAEERKELIDFLAANPTAGDLIEDTSGVRKLRFAARGKGKSGGVRVIHYYYDDTVPLYALLVYGKDEQDDLTPDQKRAVTELAAAIKAGAKKRRAK